MNYEIVGSNMQYLKVTLKKGEKFYADSGNFISKSDSAVMEPKLAGGIVSALERKWTGATAMLTEFSAKTGDATVTLSGVYPGKIYAIKLGEGEEFIAEDKSFLAADESVKTGMQTVGLGAAFFGREGIIFQKFTGPGIVAIHVAGDIIEYKLDGTFNIDIDPGHLAGFDGGINYKMKFVDNIKTAMFGGVGLFLATMSGKGRVITHSVSRHKLDYTIYNDGLAQAQKGKQ
jgi:uncharacterized protein (TIGR00266 family)